jgi:hypothetical protein
MVREIPSLDDLCRKSEIADVEIHMAIDVYLKDDGPEAFTFKSDHQVDRAETIQMHAQARKLLTDKAAPSDLRCTIG